MADTQAKKVVTTTTTSMATSERKVPVLKSDKSYLDQELNSIRGRFEVEMSKMEEEMNRFKAQLSEAERERQSIEHQQQHQQQSSTSMASNTSAHGTPATATSTTTTHVEQHPLGGGATRTSATTTERRTTTTTTRTVKSGENDLSSLQDQQQLRSDSRSGSITRDSLLNSSNQTHNTTTSTSTRSWLDGLQSPLIQDSDEGKVLKLRFDVTQYQPEEIQVKTIDNRLQVHARHEEKSENRSVYREYNREFHLPEGTDPELIKSSLSKDGVLTVDCPLPTPQLLTGSRQIPIDKI